MSLESLSELTAIQKEALALTQSIAEVGYATGKPVEKSTTIDLYYVVLCRMRAEGLLNKIDNIKDRTSRNKMIETSHSLRTVISTLKAAEIAVDSGAALNVSDELADENIQSQFKNSVRKTGNVIYEGACITSATDHRTALIRALFVTAVLALAIMLCSIIIAMFFGRSFLWTGMVLLTTCLTGVALGWTAYMVTVYKMYNPSRKKEYKHKSIFAASILSQVLAHTHKMEYAVMIKHVLKMQTKNNSLSDIYALYAKVELLGEHINSVSKECTNCVIGVKDWGTATDQGISDIARHINLMRGDK